VETQEHTSFDRGTDVELTVRGNGMCANEPNAASVTSPKCQPLFSGDFGEAIFI
jgi:hypothetical protein